jgi:hypothetical protein
LENEFAAPKLVEFVNQGGNMLVALSEESITESHRNLVYQFGLEAESKLKDDFFAQSIGSSSSNETFASGQFTHLHSFVPEKVRSGAPVLYQGIGFSVHATDNPLISTILSSNPTSTTGKLASKGSFALAAGIQAVNNARVTVVGSTAMFSDR